MDNIEKIRKFVKELQQDFISIQPKDCSLDLIKSYAGYAYLDKVLSFLDTLSEEPDKSLEEAALSYVKNKYNFSSELVYNNIGTDDFKAGAEWGAEHLRDSTKMIDKSLEEAANEFANQDCVTFISRKKGFIAGAEWQKEQMLKDAIPFYEILKAVPSFERENTRIIIVNEEE